MTEGEKLGNFAIESTRVFLANTSSRPSTFRNFLRSINPLRLQWLYDFPRYWANARFEWMAYRIYKRDIRPVVEFYSNWQNARNHLQNELRECNISEEVAEKARDFLDDTMRERFVCHQHNVLECVRVFGDWET